MAHLAIQGGAPVRTEPFHPWPYYNDREREALIKALESGQWGIDSPTIAEFERKFAEFCGARHAVACTNGTDAIYIALQAMGIGAGDEVIIPPYTFIATAIAVLMVNAVPVFADIDPLTYNIDPNSVRRCITPRTKAIIPVHIAGNPANMDSILSIAQEHNLLVLEDSAQAVGSAWKNRRVGSLGLGGTFSFQSSKNLSSGEGGAITTNDDEYAGRLRSFVNCGRVKGGLWYDHHELAGNHRLSAFQAAILNVGMDRLEEQMQRREQNACYLAGQISGIEGVSLTGSYEGTTRHAYHLLILRYQSEAFKGLTKKQFIQALEKEGIPCSSGYMPLYRFHLFQNFENKVAGYDIIYKGRFNSEAIHCPVCERVCAEEAVWITQNVMLGTKKDMEDIAQAIQKVQQYADEMK